MRAGAAVQANEECMAMIYESLYTVTKKQNPSSSSINQSKGQHCDHI